MDCREAEEQFVPYLLRSHRREGEAVDGLASGVMRRMQCRAAQ